MKRLRNIQVLGDSIFKGIQVDPATKRYVTDNRIGIAGLEETFGLNIKNQSHFGATSVKGGRLLDRLLERQVPCDAVVMDFGGNDCDFRWAEIAADPEGIHLPNVPLGEFVERYRAMVRRIRENGMTPILATLPPLVPEWFFSWWCRDLDQAAVKRWLGPISSIYTHQERYSQAVEQLAREEGTELVDVRSAFLRRGRIEELMCEDGTHPNTAGQAVIGEAFRRFGCDWERRLQLRIA